jgi:hypothetical protein
MGVGENSWLDAARFSARGGVVCNRAHGTGSVREAFYRLPGDNMLRKITIV